MSAECTKIWPDNFQAYRLFYAMSTQWRVGQCGAVGLDYLALPVVIDMLGFEIENRGDLMRDIQIMENEALAVMHGEQDE